MKILKYAPGNFKEIARVTETPIEEVVRTYNMATQLELTIYSTVGFVLFASLKVNPDVKYIVDSIINEHYRRTEAEQIGRYTQVEVNYSRRKK